MRLAVRSPRPDGPATATARGNDTVNGPPIRAPKPLGWNSTVCEAVRRQWPGVAGLSLGVDEPSTSATGFENVRRSVDAGLSLACGGGLASATAPRADGNHETRTGAPMRS